MKYIMIMNIITTAIYTPCITVAAVLFDKPWVLVWLLLLPFLMLTNTPNSEKKANNKEKNREEV